jgi:hypothetical protein
MFENSCCIDETPDFCPSHRESQLVAYLWPNRIGTVRCRVSRMAPPGKKNNQINDFNGYQITLDVTDLTAASSTHFEDIKPPKRPQRQKKMFVAICLAITVLVVVPLAYLQKPFQ